jgi:hypothetical protein
MTYWLVGRAISINTLRDGRANYGKKILGTLSQELSDRFGAGFDQTNLSRMIQFARLFPDHAEVAELVTRISWSHVYTLLAIKSDDARDFYAAEAAASG